MSMNKERLGKVFELLAVGIVLLDRKGRISFVNPAAEKVLGLDKSDIIGRLYNEPEWAIAQLDGTPVPNEDHPFEKVKNTGHPLRATYLTYPPREGAGKTLSINLAPLHDKKGRFDGAVAIIIDETERIGAERALVESEERYRSFVQNFQGIAYKSHINWVPIFFHGAVERITGYTAEDFVAGAPGWDKVIHPEDFARFSEKFDKVARVPGFSDVREYRIVRKDNGIAWVRDHIQNIPDESGKPALVQGTIYDITDLKLAEKKIEAEKERLAVTLASIGDGVISTDAKGHVVMMNPVAEKLTGWKNQEAVGRDVHDVFDIINGQTREPAENPIGKVLEEGIIVGLANDTILIAKDGTERAIADSGAPIRDSEGTTVGVVLVFRDVTETAMLQKEMLKADKLQSVGILAGGIAHDFNNILTWLIGNVTLAKIYSDKDSETHKLLTEAEKACARAQELTARLLTFARGGAPIRKPSRLEPIITESANLALRGSNVACRFNIEENLWPVNCDSDQIGQVIANLVINADQAMPEGGAVEIIARNILLENAPSKLGLQLSDGRYVKLIVKDEGIGIKDSHLPKIFDPYFSTKQEGSGLGLATVYSIIKHHEGAVTAESELGAGTSIKIFLPASEINDQMLEEGPLEGHGLNAKILLMDDEKEILDIIGRMLERLGYEIHYATEGSEAIEMYRKSIEEEHPFDAIIMDLTIPDGMGGKETIAKILELDPNARAIVSSGYSGDPIMANYSQFGFVGVIAKPYKIDALEAELTRVLNAGK